MLRKPARFTIRRLTLSAAAILALAACIDRTLTEPATPPEGTEFAIGATTSWTITDLGTLAPPGYVGGSSGARGINNYEYVVGQTTAPNPAEAHAFLWRRDTGMMHSLGTLGGCCSIGLGINDQVQVVGWSLNASGVEHAFLWTHAGGMIDLGTLGGKRSAATAINDRGQVVGTSQTKSRRIRAFFWSAETGMKRLNVGGRESRAEDINNRGVVVGSRLLRTGQWRAFLWSELTGRIDLGHLGGGESRAFGINDRGQVVGVSKTAGGEDHAFLWTPGRGMIDLQDFVELPGEATSQANGINRWGQVAGTIAVRHHLGSHETHAFRWTAGEGMIILPTLGGDSQGVGINDHGQVVGDSENEDGHRRAVRWP